MLRGGAATASVRVVPGDGEDAAAMPAPHLLRLALERGALAASRADGVLRAPAHRHVDRVAGTRDDGPALGTDRDDLDGIPRKADRPRSEERRVGKEGRSRRETSNENRESDSAVLQMTK